MRAGVRNMPKNFEQMKSDRRRQTTPHNPLHAALADGAWAGEPCFIIGGGPSLTGFDFERLRGKGRVIAINRAYEFCNFADVLFYMDNRFYQLSHKDPGRLALWHSFAGAKVFLNIMGRKYDDTYSVRTIGRIGLSNSIKTGIYHGNNSGVGAINLAYALRADPIYLLGFDCKFRGKQSHFHGGYGVSQHEGTTRSFVRDFERLNRFLVRTRARVFNLSPDSALKIFPFKSVDEVLHDGMAGQGVGADGPGLREQACAGASA